MKFFYLGRINHSGLRKIFVSLEKNLSPRKTRRSSSYRILYFVSCLFCLFPESKENGLKGISVSKRPELGKWKWAKMVLKTLGVGNTGNVKKNLWKEEQYRYCPGGLRCHQDRLPSDLQKFKFLIRYLGRYLLVDINLKFKNKF